MKEIFMLLIAIIMSMAILIFSTQEEIKAGRININRPIASYASKDLWLENRMNKIVELLERIEENTRR